MWPYACSIQDNIHKIYGEIYGEIYIYIYIYVLYIQYTKKSIFSLWSIIHTIYDITYIPCM
jgi:hypothetical protein